MIISASLVKELRSITNAGMMECKKSLVECDGDINKAVKHLREKGLAMAKKRSSRTTKEGRIFSYIHLNNKLGVLVEINCETDFVAKTDDFNEMSNNIAMQVAASAPLFVDREQVSPEILEQEREIYRKQSENKPPQAIEKIVEGKIEKYLKQVCLMEQSYIKDPDVTVNDYIASFIAKLGENITVRRFVRFQMGEE
ncbi:MAG: translation elongation factor Ts [bacterium]|nr:translation elongation factor Ts [bacterium]